MYWRVILLSGLLITPSSTLADDAQRNPLAKRIKAKVLKHVKKHTNGYVGYCDVMIEMHYHSNRAEIKSVRTNGDSKVCHLSKAFLKKGTQYRYIYLEKYIQLHISP